MLPNESKNAMADYLFFGEEGEVRRRDYESQKERKSLSAGKFADTLRLVMIK